MNKSDKPPHLSIEFAETIISIDEYLFTGCRTGIYQRSTFVKSTESPRLFQIPKSANLGFFQSTNFICEIHPTREVSCKH